MAKQTASPEVTELLVRAVRANDVLAARDVLTQHPSIRSRLNDALPGLDFGGTPLLGALRHRNTELMQLLLDAGADINQKSHWWAGGFGVLDDDHELTSWLVARGATVDAHAAARHGLMDSLRALVSADPSQVHARGGDGATPLHVARTIEVVDYLLSHGADIDAIDVDHESTPAQWMIGDRTELARHLLSRGARADLFLHAALGNLEGARAALDADPSFIEATINDQWFPRRNVHASLPMYFWTLGANKTPHRVARDFGHEAVFALLMDRSPDDLRIAVACELEDEPLLATLTENGTKRVAPSDSQQIKLVWAAEGNNARTVRLLLNAGWPADAHKANGQTALHFACWHGNAGMVRELLRAGAPTDVRETEHGGTPRDWAEHGVHNSWHRNSGNYPEVMAALNGE